MIYINQNKDLSELDRECNRIGFQNFSLNTEVLDVQKKRLKSTKESTKNKNIVNTVNALEKNLLKVEKMMDDSGNIEVCWNVKDWYLSSYPVSFLEARSCGIVMYDLINNNNDRLVVKIKAEMIQDIITFEYIYSELGYTIEDIEKALGDVGPTGFYPSSILAERISNFTNVYMYARNCVVGDSPYIVGDGKKMTGYFVGTEYKVGKNTKYKDIINNTCRIAMSVIASETMDRVRKSGGSVELVAVGNDYVTMIVDKETDVSSICDTVVLRTFGRQMVIETKSMIL